MEVVLPRIRISEKRSQEHQEEQQPKKAKNEDDEMDIGKIEDEEVDDASHMKSNPRGTRKKRRSSTADLVRFWSKSLTRWRGKRSWI